MQALKVTGGVPLEGTVKAAGAKNAITKMLVASLLSDKKCVFTNVPNIVEVETTINLCSELGMEVSWDRDSGVLEAQTRHLSSTYVPQRFSGANRIPILLIGAMLGRTNEDIIVPTIGGCKIGPRPVNFHIEALEKLGAKIEYRGMKKEGAYFAQAHDGLKGTVIELAYPSVGATENTILAACRAKGTTVIKNAAVEPELVDLVLFLQKLGVEISMDVNRTIIIRETKQFYEVQHHVITDRIEAASLGMVGIATGGRVFVEGANQMDMIPFLNRIRAIGAGFQVKETGIEFFATGKLKGGLHLETDVHPGFLTDWQQPFVVLLSQAEGISVIHETVYENRFGYTKTLSKMGAELELFKQCLGNKDCRFSQKNFAHSLVIKGPTRLNGCKIEIPDLRAGFAYVMAALIAEGESEITNLQYLDRGYENIDQKLSSLGAQIKRTQKTKHPLEALLAK
ncbi:MAG: UDP-N-acetylglucosamine 1-carboxyvinyltransferase 1 [Chlamydiia bacterium]|nr:UDP-N-acetylglucosamine 1-carboxyvinyltransferase 1 [Chlamydiia bacterium]MCH9616497.1 UDP-N-acetylglucosamine 1-carboxyvinyltransferase 1 [Chlamydiia bacterium]MCH9629517.1 UDP-N-acetylglucosamine 1-carboxyvinyltransferase 1 [Chlamydiia bacterium]